MTEHDQEPYWQEDYWQQDLAIGEGIIDGEHTGLRLRAHVVEEHYRGRDDGLIHLTHATGARVYIQARPYILEPEITLTIGTYDVPTPEGVVGEVLSSQWEGLTHRDIGQAQGWGYPADRVAVLWECYLFDRYRDRALSQDRTMVTLWAGVERLLLTQLPGLERIVTPSWEDIYELPDWQAFLARQGYRCFSERAFLKEVASTP